LLTVTSITAVKRILPLLFESPSYIIAFVHECSPAGQELYFVSTSIISPEIKSSCQLHCTWGFEVPYSQMINSYP